VEQSSQYITDQNWARQHFPTRIRYIRILIKGEDVLTPNGLRQVTHAIIHKQFGLVEKSVYDSV